jgi:hypothetical protein
MRIVEEKVSSGDRPLFALAEFLSRPLFAHLAHLSESGPRESPVWFLWDGGVGLGHRRLLLPGEPPPGPAVRARGRVHIR